MQVIDGKTSDMRTTIGLLRADNKRLRFVGMVLFCLTWSAVFAAVVAVSWGVAAC